MIDIRDKKGNIRYSVEVSERSVYHKELMAEEYVLLTFETERLVHLRKGDYIETEFGRFEIVTVDKPQRNVSSDGGWSYEQKFCPPWAKWVNRKMFYNRQKGSEKAWKMTQLPKYFMQILVDNLREAGFGDWSYTIDASLTEMKLVEFDSTNLLDALTLIAQTWETEWWITDNVIHLSKCEYGSPVVFEEGDVVNGMEREDGQDTDYITRLYAFGSTRNVPQDYRKNEDDSLVIEGVVERRLKLPAGIDHIDAWDNMQPEDVVEGIVVLDEIYPHRVGTMSNITTKEYTDKVEQEDGSTEEVKWNAYRFKDTGVKFSKEYIIPGEELRIIFQSGTLAGMDFAVTFNPDGLAESQSGAQLWEIVRNEDYGIALPSENFKPSNGDTYILYGYDTKFVSDRLIPQAEQELLAKAHEIILKKSQDKSIYNCPTDPVRCAGYKERNGEMVYLPSDVVDLDIGQAVELRNEGYFDNGYRISRVRSFEKRLDNRYSCTYTVGESAAYSSRAALEEKVDSITYNNTQYFSGGGSGVYVIKRHDGTTPSDHNVYSSLRAKSEFLHKVNPDVATGLKKFLDGIEAGFYEEGVSGGKFDKDGNLEAHSLLVRTLAKIATAIVGQIGSEKFVDGFFGEGFQIWKMLATGDWSMTIDRLTVRKLMTVYELLIAKIRAVGGQLVVSAGNGKIKTVETDESGENYLIKFEDTNTFAEGDLMRCQVWTGSGIKYYWVRVSSSDGDTITVPISEFEGVQPEEGDECVLMGNTDNPLRQNLISISATEDGQPRIDVLNGVKSKSFEGCLRARLGNLDGISDNYFPADNQPHGDGLYADNAYLRGTFVLSTGEDVKTRFEILEGRISSEIQSVEKELMAYESYLRNAYFNDNMDGWEIDNSVTFFLIGNKWIWLNDKPYANKTAYTGITTDRNRTVLYIKNRYLLQRNENFESHPVCDEKDIDGKFLPKKFYLSFFYRCITPGTLKIEFEGANQDGFSPFEMLSVNQEIEATGEEYKTFETTGLWNGTGDFRLSFSGEMYLYAVRLSLDRIADIEQRYKTFFEQTDKKFTLAAEERAETTRKLEEYHTEMTITAREIRSEVSASLTDLETGMTEKLNTAISQTEAKINLVASRFNDDGSIKNTAGLVTTAEANKMFAFDSAGNLVSFIEQTASDIKIKAKFISLEGLVTANENFKILEDGSIIAQNGKFIGEIETQKGLIGGFEIASGRIGSATTSDNDYGGGLAIYDDFFRVGAGNGYVMFGDDVIPSSAGGAFTAAGRIVNTHPNTSGNYGFDQANYGLFISVSGGTKNYGISSNAALMAPAFINTKAKLLTFSGSTYSIDFSQNNIILLYYNNPNYSRIEVTLPTESSVARQFGLSSLPTDFAATVIFRVRTGSKRIILKGIYNQNEGTQDYAMEQGDSVMLLITKADGFRYQIINYSS